MAKTVAALEAELRKSEQKHTKELAKLTKAHDEMVRETAKQAAEDLFTIEDLKAKAEAAKAEAKKQREEKAEEHKKDMKAKLDAEPHQWVQVFYKGLKDGVDFAFNYEGIQFLLYSGVPIFLAESVIKHLKGCGYPIIIEKQGEAGQPIKVHGRHHNFNVVNCEAPKEDVKTAVA